MRCLSKTEIEDYLRGKLPADRMLEAVLHIQDCGECRALVAEAQTFRTAAHQLEQHILDCACPEYEELTAFVDEKLPETRTRYMQAHVSSCEVCSRDVETMQRLRSRALLAPKISVAPSNARQASAWSFWFPRIAPAAGAMVAAAMVTFVLLGGLDRTPAPIKPPSIVVHDHSSEPLVDVQEEPRETSTIATADEYVSEQTPIAEPLTEPDPRIERPRPTVVARAEPEHQIDYSKLRAKEGKIDRVKQAVDEKLKTGKLTGDEPIRVAMANTVGGVRSLREAIGPRPISPISQTVMYDNLMLQWRLVEGAEEYKVELTDSQGNILVSHKTENSQLTIRSSEISSQGGIFLWRVAARMGAADFWESSRAVVIHVLSDEDSRMIRGAKTTYAKDHLLLGTIYELHGLYQEAEGEFRKLVASSNRPPNAEKMLSSVREKL